MVTRREVIAGGSGLVGGSALTGGSIGLWNFLTGDPEMPEGELNLERSDEQDVNWTADVESGDEFASYNVRVDTPGDETRSLENFTVPEGQSSTRSGQLDVEGVGTYILSLNAQTGTYDETLDEAAVTVLDALEPSKGEKKKERDDKEKKDWEDKLDYRSSNLPYSDIDDALGDQDNDDISDFEDTVFDAYVNRDKSVSETAEDAFVEVDDATLAEYLHADSNKRDDLDVFLGFENGNEGVKMRGTASAGADEDFEEYMVGLQYLDDLEHEMKEYVEDLEDNY